MGRLPRALRSGGIPGRGAISVWEVQVDRRDLLKKAGMGSAALAAIPAIGNGLATVALADGAEGFHFVCVSVASSTETEILAMQGDGRFNEKEADGGGRFVHFHGSTTISGSWKAG